MAALKRCVAGRGVTFGLVPLQNWTQTNVTIPIPTQPRLVVTSRAPFRLSVGFDHGRLEGELPKSEGPTPSLWKPRAQRPTP